jgi:hypothetical protein
MSSYPHPDVTIISKIEKAVRYGNDLTFLLEGSTDLEALIAFENITLSDFDVKVLTADYFYNNLRQFFRLVPENKYLLYRFFEVIIKANVITARFFYDLDIHDIMDDFFLRVYDHLGNIKLLDKISRMFFHINLKTETVIALITNVLRCNDQTSLLFFKMLCTMSLEQDFCFSNLSAMQLSQKIKIMVDSGIRPRLGMALMEVTWKMDIDNFKYFECLKAFITDPDILKVFETNIIYYRQASFFDPSDLRDIIYPDVLRLIREYVFNNI